MDTVEIIALTLGIGWASGINLYAAVLALGLLGTFGYMELPPKLEILTTPAVMGAAGLMYCIEFFADKVPGLDSLWDAVHTFIRVPAGAVLAAGAVGEVDPSVQLAAALVGGALAGGSHFTKAGTRAIINTSPEPLTNAGASVAEDALVVAGVWTMGNYPSVFLVALALMTALALWAMPRLYRGAKRIVGRARTFMDNRRAS